MIRTYDFFRKFHNLFEFLFLSILDNIEELEDEMKLQHRILSLQFLSFEHLDIYFFHKEDSINESHSTIGSTTISLSQPASLLRDLDSFKSPSDKVINFK